MEDIRTYDLHSEFDIEKHRVMFPYYCEILIESNGHVVYAVPSHQEKAIELACKAKGWTREQLNDACPQEYYGDFITWLLMQSGAIAVWNHFYMGIANENQRAKLRELKAALIYEGMDR